MAPTIYKNEVDDSAIPEFKTVLVTSHKTVCILPLWSEHILHPGTVHAALKQNGCLSYLTVCACCQGRSYTERRNVLADTGISLFIQTCNR